MIDLLAIDQYVLSAFTGQLSGYKPFFFIITEIGSPLALSLMATLLLAFGKNKLRVLGAVLIISLIFGCLIVDDVKDIIQRHRPPGAELTKYIIKDSYSFPSGHAVGSFLAAAIVGAYLGWKYRVAGYVFAAAVSVSRLYLGVHYPTDVLAGAILGTALGELIIYTAYRWELCDNAGLLSFLVHPLKRPARIRSLEFKGNFVFYIVVAIGFAAMLVLYNLSLFTWHVAIMVTTFGFITLYLHFICQGQKSGVFPPISIIAVGLISAFSLTYMGSYLLSLVVILLTYLALMALNIYKTGSGHGEHA